jgi:hypothetical protein
VGAKASSRVVPQEFTTKLLSLHLQRQELFLFPVSAPERRPTEKEQNTMENQNITFA